MIAGPTYHCLIGQSVITGLHPTSSFLSSPVFDCVHMHAENFAIIEITVKSGFFLNVQLYTDL